MSQEFSEQRLGGRVIVVTGGGHGIGRAYAHRLSAEGAQIIVAEIDAPAAEMVAKELTSAGREAIAVHTDLADQESVTKMAETTISTFGKVDGLVNNAAIFTSVPLERSKPEDLSYDHFEQVLRVNVLGTWLCSKLVIPDMRKRHYDKIVNVSSGTAFKGNGTNMLQYVTSKGAILSFTRVLTRAVGDDGIRVNCVAPGGTAARTGSPLTNWRPTRGRRPPIARASSLRHPPTSSEPSRSSVWPTATSLPARRSRSTAARRCTEVPLQAVSPLRCSPERRFRTVPGSTAARR